MASRELDVDAFDPRCVHCWTQYRVLPRQSSPVLFIRREIVILTRAQIVAVDLITPETKFSNIARAFSRRTGRVATQNLPVLFALVGRNNPVSLMTGIGYQETRFIHKLVGVLVFVETIIHTFGYVGYYIVSLGSAQLYKEYTRFYFQMGIVVRVINFMRGIDADCALQATVGGFMCFAFGVHYFRRRHYEFFLVSHSLSISNLVLDVADDTPGTSPRRCDVSCRYLLSCVEFALSLCSFVSRFCSYTDA